MLLKVGRRPKSMVLSMLLPKGARMAPGSVSAESVIIGEKIGAPVADCEMPLLSLSMPLSELLLVVLRRG